MVSLADLKKNRQNKFAELQNQARPKQGFVNHDAKCWKPTLDKAGSAYAIFRFLPAPVFLSEEEKDYVTLEVFNIKRIIPGQAKPSYYIENSLKTLGKEDPADKLKWELWNSGDASKKELFKQMKNRQRYYTNIYMIKDQNNPQNEGKVFPYVFGPQIFEKIQNALTPEFESDVPFNPFDLWEGHNFVFKATTDPVKKMPDYSKSMFEQNPSVLFEDDDQIDNVWRQSESLLEWVGEDRFKPYEQLEKRVYQIMGLPVPTKSVESVPSNDAVVEKQETVSERVNDTPEVSMRSEPEVPETKSAAEVDLDDDDEFLRQFGSDLD